MIFAARFHIIGILFSKCPVIVKGRLVRIDGEITFKKRRKYCNECDTDNADNQTCCNKYRQLFCFSHGNYRLELDLGWSLDRFFELQVLEFDQPDHPPDKF